MLGFARVLFFLIFYFSCHCEAIQQRITVSVPKTAYLQWVESPGQMMTSTSQTSKTIHFSDPYSKDFYLAVMCNSLSGYEIALTAISSISDDSAIAVGSYGNDLEYKVQLFPETRTFLGGTIHSYNLNLSGSSPSIRVFFQSPSSLPMRSNRPHVWRVVATPTSSLRANEVYTGGIIATVFLP